LINNFKFIGIENIGETNEYNKIKLDENKYNEIKTKITETEINFKKVQPNSEYNKNFKNINEFSNFIKKIKFLKIIEIIQIIEQNNINLLTEEKIISLFLLCNTVFEKNNIIICLLTIQNEINISDKPETIYRVNSLSSKYITIFCKLYGNVYLKKFFSILINQINFENENLEGFFFV
jgi:hypothetical protein